MTKEFNSLEEIQKYYDVKSNTYVFKEDGDYIDLVVFNFNLNLETKDIKAKNINAMDINARDIDTWDINARDIYARDIYAEDINSASIVANNISYFAVCFAYSNIRCKSIKGRREKSKHFVLDGKLEVLKNE